MSRGESMKTYPEIHRAALMYPYVPGQRYEFVMDLASRLWYPALFR